jgi:mandelate racemase
VIGAPRTDPIPHDGPVGDDHLRLGLRGFRVRSVLVPLDPPLQTASGDVPEAPLVLLDLDTAEGMTGRSYLFCYTPLALAALGRLVGDLCRALADVPLTPVSVRTAVATRFRLLRPQGLVTMAAAGIDIAVWDAVAQAAGRPLVSVLGGRPGPVPGYASLRSMRPAAAAGEAERHAGLGFAAFKVKLGLADVAADVEVVRAIRSAVGDEAQVAVDYNQSLDVPEAIRRIRRLADEGPLWVEEPTDADDYAGHARIRDSVDPPIQLGESWWGIRAMSAAIAAGASDLAMVDIIRMGGVSGWTAAAALAHAHGLPLSSHLFPEISAHVLPVTPSAHLLEYLDIAAPLLAEPTRVDAGTVTAPDRPGTGMVWDEDALAHHMRNSGETLTWSR